GDGFGAAHAHRGRHGADQLAVLEDADLFGVVVGDGDVRVANLERDVLVLLTVEPGADRDAIEAGRDVDRSAWRVVLLGPPVGGLVVDPVPRPDDGWVCRDDEVAFGVGLVGDRFVEHRDDDGAHTVGRAVFQQAARGVLEIDLGLVAGAEGGEAGGLARRHAAGAAGGGLQGVGGPVAGLAGGLPGLGVGGHDAGG